MSVLVTGATGFVGHHLAAVLRAGGADVHALVRDPDVEPVPEGVEAHAADIRDPAAVAQVVDAVGPERIAHLAGASSVGESFARPLETWDVNLDGTLAVLEAARRAARPPRVLAVTSGEVYGRVPLDELPVTHETPLTPVSPYGASKAAADLAVGQYHDGYGLDVMRVRSFNHFGPGQDPRFVIPSIARQLAEAERAGGDGPVEIHVGNIDTRRDFTDVRDVVRAYALLLERGRPGDPYLVCTGRSLSIRDVIDGLAALCTRDVRVVSDAGLRRSGEQSDLYGSPERVRVDTGWAPAIPLEQTLADTLAWWRERPDTET